MSEPTGQRPFQLLGNRLKYLRQQSRESLAEVSGAVEIDELALERIETGQERPPEEVLMLLINHFNMQDHEAIRLWELAGYEGGVPDELRPLEDAAGTKPNLVLLAIDARVQYSDGVEINAGPGGVVMNFSQQGGQRLPLPVARVGMSYEQAQRVLMALQRALLEHRYGGPKGLPPARK